MIDAALHPTRRLALGFGILMTSGIAVGLGNAFIPVYYAAGGNAPTIMAARYAWCIAISIGVLMVLRRPLRLPFRQILSAGTSGALFGAGAISVISAFMYIPVGVAILILFTFPILTSLLQALLSRRLPGMTELICLVVALSGVGLTVGLDEISYDPRGIALALLGSAAVTVAFIAGGRALDAADPIVVSTFVALAALATALAFSAVSERGLVTRLGDGGWHAFLFVVLTSAIAFFGLMAGMKLLGAVPAAMMTNLEVVFTLLFATIFLGEALTRVKLAGAAVVIGAVLVAQSHSLWRRRAG
ncbi:MAG: DMT family transporter [Hyphomicrobiaceae bacterium]